MRNSITALLLFFAQLGSLNTFCQKKIVILGSSTAYGNGASTTELSWAGRLQASFRKNINDGVDTIIENRAYPGYYTYNSLPTGYDLPANRTNYGPDPQRNITYVLGESQKADIVIISYPNNDVFLYDYDPKETMNNLRLMYHDLTTNGITCYISSSQPRNDASIAQRIILKQLVDSLKNNFGNYAINFWDDLVSNDGQNRLKDEVNYDNIHPNDLGHQLLFQQVQAKDIFSTTLPISLKKWEAVLENHFVTLKWVTANEEPNTSFEIQRSENGRNFRTLCKLNANRETNNYKWSDLSPVTGRSFYRLKINEPARISYSNLISIVNNKNGMAVNLHTSASSLQIQIGNLTNQSAELSIISLSGAIIQKQSFSLSNSTNISMPISELSSGEYFLLITTSDGSTDVERFVK